MAQRALAPSSKNIWGFDPRTIGSCTLWLDGADSNTISISSGTNVSSWTDKSGQGNNASNVITGFGSPVPPTYTASNKYVQFGGSSAMTTNLSASSNTETGFVVASITALATNTFLGGTVSGGFNTGGRQFRTSVGGTYGTLTYNNGGITSYASIAMNSPFGANVVGLLNYTISGGAPTLYEYGTTLGTGTTATLTASRITVIGARGGATSYLEPLTGNIYEILVFNSALATQQRQIIEGYLSWKWGLQANLPATHPYSSTAGTIMRPFARQFQPVDIPGCALWLDGADSSTLTLVGGTKVSQWNDKSGNGLNATQGTDANRPTILNTQNGYNTLNFNRSSYQYLTISGNSTTGLDFGAGDVTFFAVANFAVANLTSGNLSNILTKNYPTLQFWQFGAINSGGQQVRFVMQNPFQAISSSFGGGTLNNGWDFIAYTLSLSGAQPSTLFIHGTSGATNQTFTSENTTSNGTVYVGSSSRGSTNSGDSWNSDIAEIIVYKSFLTTSQRQQVEAYLGWKWGIRSSFSTTHPFYKIPSNTVTPFNPRSISGLSIWLDAADSSTITLSGSNVSQWNDKSGNSDNAVQATGANQPTYSNNSIVFNSLSSQYMTLSSPSTLPNGATPTGTYFFVTRLTTGSAVQAFFMYGPTTLTTGANPQFYYNSSNQLVLDTFGAGGTTDTTNVLNTTVVFSSTISNSAGTGTVTGWRNSNSFGPTTYSTASITSQKGFIGVTQTGVGTSGTLAYYFTGNIYEIVIYNSVLTTSQRQQIEGYLAWKWGVQSSLPSSHPYKKIIP